MAAVRWTDLLASSAEDVLDASFCDHHDGFGYASDVAPLAAHVGAPSGPRRRVPDRPTLHEDDGLLAVAANRRGGQAEHVSCLGASAGWSRRTRRRRGGIRPR
jgi:hypothetical protein